MQNDYLPDAEAPSTSEETQWRSPRDPSVVNQIQIPATMVHKILHSRFNREGGRTLPRSYVESITVKLDQINSMDWGNLKEPEARLRYQEVKSLSEGRRVCVFSPGLFTDPKWPWLCAKPDGIVTDSNSGQWLSCLEVKCPFKYRNSKLEDACNDPNFCLEILNPGTQPVAYRLKQSHEYFQQVQVQLALTGLQTADFVVYTLQEMAIVPVTFDPVLWQDTISKLEVFIEKYILSSTLRRSEEEATEFLELSD